jgi:hypothetical protein
VLSPKALGRVWQGGRSPKKGEVSSGGELEDTFPPHKNFSGIPKKKLAIGEMIAKLFPVVSSTHQTKSP